MTCPPHPNLPPQGGKEHWEHAKICVQELKKDVDVYKPYLLLSVLSDIWVPVTTVVAHSALGIGSPCPVAQP